MKNPSLHRYATRPGLYFTDDGGADAIVRSETADQVWFCVLEPLDQPSAFYADAVRLFNEPGLTFIDQAMKQRICTRRIPSLNLRETLFRMDGPNYGLWYVHVPQAWDGMQYGYRVNGPWDPDHGVSFNPYKLLLDPYAKGIEGSMELDPGAFSYECEIVNGKVKGSPFGPMSTIDSVGHVPVSVAIDDRATNKHDGEPSHPHVAWSKTVIYELHVKGFTANAPWLPKELRGTYAGLAHPATLARLDGEFTRYHPFLYALRSDMLLGNLKMIMEPWDCGPNGWRTGEFGIPFAEWNDRFRDCTRKFWLTDVDRMRGGEYGEMTMQEMATRLCGSSDLFATDPGRGSTASVNYVACHDGFTTADLTMYKTKHNEANGENNRDGTNDNHSVNFGHEGPSGDQIIVQQRQRATMNLLGTLLLSLGTPMLLAGDEFGNSQNGNNNAYTQDNDTTWLDWDWLYSTEQTPELKQFNLTSRLITLRKSRDLYNHEDFFTRLSEIGLLKKSDRVHWYLPNGQMPNDADWTNPSVRSFAMQLLSPDEPSLLILINGSDEVTRFHLPKDIEWEMVWSSSEIVGEYPGLGTSIERVSEFDEESESKPAGRLRNHLHRINMMYWQMKDDADNLQSADDGLSEDDPTLWTLPALSISAMKQMPTI